MQRKKIGVFPSEEFPRFQLLLENLSGVYPVDFEACEDWNQRSFDAAVAIGVTREQAVKIAGSGLRCLAFTGRDASAAVLATGDLRFSSLPYLTEIFRGRTLPDVTVNRIHRLDEQPGDEVVARKGDDILWIRRSDTDAEVDFIGIEPPQLLRDDRLFRYFRKDDWVRLFPLLHFLQELSGWQPAPIRACFMFDDPNLHWPSYGYLDFGQLAQQAHQHNYHVAIATIPLDSWFSHPRAAEIFRQNSSRLSLLCHGNNHTCRELLNGVSVTGDLANLAQALRRIESLEQRAGLEVSRVMAAPHSACSEMTMANMVRVGFEAASISTTALSADHPDAEWAKKMGLAMTEMIAGLPIIPRFRISRNCQISILLAAFLNQPIILAGHHQDGAAGLGLLAELAALINSLGQVRWLDMKSIARSNFSLRQLGETLDVKMYSRFVQIRIPAGVRLLQVEGPGSAKGVSDTLVIRDSRQQDQPLAVLDRGATQAVPVTAEMELEISVMCPDAIEPGSVPRPKLQAWALMRRPLTECRDRISPFAPSFGWQRLFDEPNE
jgi:hypothetical protein